MRQYQSFRDLLMVALALACFASFSLSYAAPCTPATCSGPVIASFSSRNCSGEAVFEEVGNEYDTCVEGRSTRFDDKGMYFYFSSLSNPVDCDYTAANAGYNLEFVKFGACNSLDSFRRSSGASWLMLKSVNDSFISPQDFDNQPLPAFIDEGTYDCANVDECTLPNGETSELWYNTYNNSSPDTCQVLYSTVHPSAFVNLCMNYYNMSYVKQGCFEAHGTYFGYFSDAACTQPISFSATRYVCDSYRSQVQCVAAITPLPSSDPSPPEPTSAASSTHLSLFLGLLVASIAFFGFF
jgi:hypothetical protein